MANLIYCYAETLPASISQRDYSRFHSSQDIIAYTDSCIKELQILDSPEEISLDKYVGLCIEIHDMLDQYSDCFSSPKYGDASDYTVRAMKATDRILGKNSELFANLFAEYLSYDCNGEVSKALVDMIGQDMFSLDSTYYSHIRYRLNRKLYFLDNTLNLIFYNRTKQNREELNSESSKELLWALFQIPETEDIVSNKLFDIALVHYTPITNDIKAFMKSVEARQKFMDGTGIMLSLYALSNNKISHKDRLNEIRQRVQILEKCFVNLTGETYCSKRINGVHLIAYLQAWKDFLKSNNAGEKNIFVIDSIVSDYLQLMPVIPHSYTVASNFFNRLNTSYAIPFDFEESNKESNIATIEYLNELNSFIKNSDLFMNMESSLPPIFEYEMNKLEENKKYMNFLRYCVECIDYIDKYFDSAFTWFVDYSNEATIEYSENRKENLLADGWTGKSGDKYVATNRILEEAVDYIILHKYFHNPSTPVLLSKAAKIKYDLGDFSSALLYSKIANELFELGESTSTEDRIINNCVFAKSKYIVNNDSSEFSNLENLISRIEEIISKHSDDKNYSFLKRCLVQLYSTVADFKINTGDISSAEEWNEKILDEVFCRKDSIWLKGGSILFPYSEDFIPVRYRSWKIEQLQNSNLESDSLFKQLKWEIDGVGLKDIPFNLENIVAKTYDLYYRFNKIEQEKDFTYIPRRQSDQIRFNIQKFGASMHPSLRKTYYDIVRSEIENYNGILAHSDSIVDAECIYNNLLIFHGLQLLNEQLISSVINHDDEYKKAVDNLTSGSFIDAEDLISFFKSDTYRKKAEERALSSKNIQELLSIDYKNVQQNLDKKSVAIEFFRSPFWDDKNNPIPKGEKRWGYYAALLKGEGAPEIIPLCSETELLNSISKSRAYNKKVTDFIWTHLLPHLNEISTIYFVPDGELHNIAIEYLPFNDNKSIIEKYNIFRLSSTRILVNRQPESQNVSGSLFGYMHYQPESSFLSQSTTKVSEENNFIGDRTRGLHRYVSNERGSVEDLPNTKLEISNIAEEFKRKKRNCSVFTGYNATESAFKELSGKAPDILHVATHGIYWTESDLENLNGNMPTMYFSDKSKKENALNRSVLLFSGVNTALQGKYNPEVNGGDDGILTAEEVASLDLQNVNMLSLSACQTALGEIKGDGVFGLQRGFKKAGVKSILMSLWNVDDKATNIFMTAFYKYYLGGKTKLESLRHAINVTKKFNPNPKYWAAFILLDGLN